MKCYAAGCNYGTRHYKGPKRSKFRFPEDPERRRQWILACRRANSVPGKFSSLCDAHFEPDLIVFNAPEPKVLPDGTVLQSKQRGHYCPRLQPHAVPTIFFEDPSGPRLGGTQTKRRLPEDEEFPVDEILAKSLAEIPPKTEKKRKSAKRRASSLPNSGKNLHSLQDVLKCIETMSTFGKDMQFSSNWLHILRQNAEGDEADAYLLLYLLDTGSDPPVMTKSLKISADRLFDAYDRGHKITEFVLENITMRKNRFRNWEQILDALSLLENYSVEAFQFDYDPPEGARRPEYGEILRLLSSLKQRLQSVGSSSTDEQAELSKVSFLAEQVALLDMDKYRQSFSDALRSWTAHLGKKGADVVHFLRTSGSLSLPEVFVEPEPEEPAVQTVVDATAPSVTLPLPRIEELIGSMPGSSGSR